MFGAIYGDIIGSYYELHCTKNYDFEFNNQSFFTDDSVLTAAVCRAILQNPENVNIFGIKKRAFEYAVQYKRFIQCFLMQDSDRLLNNGQNQKIYINRKATATEVQ